MFQVRNLQRWVISLLILMVGLGFAWPRFTSAAMFANRSSVIGSEASSHVGQIAFGSTRDGNWEIYLMNADGTGQTNLTNNPAQDSSAAWSPDGHKIAFDSIRDGNWEIYLMNPDGSAQTRLTNNSGVDVAPDWSPDGSKMAFESDRDGNREIYLMNADGTGQSRLTNNSVRDGAPVWSPDGQKIAYTSFRNGNVDIYVINVDGTNESNLTNQPASDEWDPVWSPDGSKIAFESTRDGNSEIYVMNVDGTNQTRLTFNSVRDANPAWSPDSSQIAFTSARDGNWEIYAMNADGSQQANLTTYPGDDWLAAWRPVVDSGPFIYVSASSSGNVDGLSFKGEDILAFDTASGTWAMHVDGSDVGLSGNDVHAFVLADDGSIWMSFNEEQHISGLGTVDESDIVKFVPTSLGQNTAGSFEWLLDGSDVGLAADSEDIDALGLAPDGRLVISTRSSVSVPGLSAKDEDLIVFNATSLGENTSGSWELYFDGSDVNLTSSDEDLRGSWIDKENNDVYLTTLGDFSVSGLSGDENDIFICDPSSLGNDTSCTFRLFWDGGAHGFAGNVDAFAVGDGY